MREDELLKKKKRPKRTSVNAGHDPRESTWPTLGRIVLSNGSEVDIPKLPLNSSELTTYDHLRIAMEHAAVATCCVRELGLQPQLKVTLKDCLSLDNVLLNLQDLMNHLYYAIEGYPKEKGSS